MKKFRVALLSFLVLCFAPVLVACGTSTEQIYRVKMVEFTEENIAMSVDAQPYQLEWEIEDNVALNQKVTFSSSRPEVATVSETGVVTPVSTGVTVISVVSDDNPKAKTNTCTIRVLPLKQTLATPTNLKYDFSTGELSWDKVIENTNGDWLKSTSSFVPKYELTLKTSNETKTKTVSSNVFNELEAGVAYKISVKALGNEYLYNDSASTEEISVHVLASPQNLKVVSDANYDALNSGDDMLEAFVENKQIAQRSYKLTFDLATDSSELTSAYNVVMYNERGEAVSGELKQAFDLLLAQAKIEEQKFVMPLFGIPAGDYYFAAYQKGDVAQNTYDSAVITTKLTKFLATPTNLVLTEEQVDNQKKLTLSWNSVSFAKGYQILIEYKNTLDDNEAKKYINVYSKNDGNCFYDLSLVKDLDNNLIVDTQYAVFNVYMRALGSDPKANERIVLDGEVSTEVARAQLAQVRNIRLAQERQTSQDIQVCWDSVTNAGTYKAAIYKSGQEVFSSNVQSNSLTVAKDASWFDAGEYELKVVALPQTNQNYTQSVESEGFRFVKLATPSVLTNNGIIRWSSVENVDANTSYTLHYKDQNAQDVSIELADYQTVYDFGTYVYNSGNYTDFYVVANADKTSTTTLVDSDQSAHFTVNKLKLPNKFSVQNGQLGLSTNVGSGDNVVSYALFALKVFEEQNPQNVVANTNLSLETLDAQIKSIVSSLQKGKVYVFEMSALAPNVSNQNYLYVKSNSVQTRVYVAENVQNIRTVDGVVTFDMPTNLFELVSKQSNGNVVLDNANLTSVFYAITNGTNQQTQSVPAVLNGKLQQTSTVEIEQALGGQAFSLGFRIVFANAQDPDIAILNSDTTFESFEKLASVSILRLEQNGDDRMLVLQKSPAQNLKYEFKLTYKDAENQTKNEIVVLDTASPFYNNQIETYENFDKININDLIDTSKILEGDCTITLKVYPTSSTIGNFIASNTSDEFVFKKINQPTLEIDGNYVVWNVANSGSTGLSFDLVVNDETISGISDTRYDLSDPRFFGELDISVKAISGLDNLLSSNPSKTLKVVKLNTFGGTKTKTIEGVDTTVVEGVCVKQVESNNLTWVYENFDLNLNGEANSTEIKTTKFAYKVFKDTNQSQILAQGEIEANQSGEFVYTMPQTQNFDDGAYTLVVRPLAKGVISQVSLIDGFVDGDEHYLHIYKMPQLNDAKMQDNNLVWNKLDFSAWGSSLNVEYHIVVSGLDNYVYVAKEADSSATNITYAGVFENTNYNYSIPLDANDNFVVPLQKSEFESAGGSITIDDGGIIQSILPDFANNYLKPGTTFSLKLSTNIMIDSADPVAVSTKAVVHDGLTYYMFDSNTATIKNITLLDAPNVLFANGVMSWTNSKTNFEQLEFNFEKYNWDGSTRSTSQAKVLTKLSDTKQILKQSYNVRSLELSSLFDNKEDQNTCYILSVQSIGNGKTTISSKKITLNYVISNIAPIKIKNTTNIDGWYVKDGELAWGRVDGAKTYVIKFEQLRAESDTVITNTLEIKQNDTALSQYTYLPDSEMYLTGSFLVSMRVLGDVYYTASLASVNEDKIFEYNGKTYNTAYANSVYETGQEYVQKLHQIETNNTMTVSQGELSWDNNQKQVVSSYDLCFTDMDTQQSALEDVKIAQNDEDKLEFVFSNTSLPTSVYGVSVRAIGSTWNGRIDSVPENGIYLSSRLSNNFRFRYIESTALKPKVTNGLFNWSVSDEGVGAENWNPSFSVGVVESGQTQYTWLDAQNSLSNDLQEYANKDIDKLAIKVVGTQQYVATQTPLLNSGISTELTKLKKLPDLANYTTEVGGVEQTYDSQIIINQIGDLVWNCGYESALCAQNFDTQLSVTIKDGRTGVVYGRATTYSLGKLALNDSVTYNYEDPNGFINFSVSPIYEFGVNVVGSEEYQLDSAKTTYLSSNPALISAQKFGSITNFGLQNGVNLAWNTDRAVLKQYDNENSTTQIVLPTKYILEYATNVAPNDFSRIVFDAQNGSQLYNNIAQFVQNGTYIIRLSVFKDNTSFRSSPVYCVKNSSKEIVFEGVYDGLEYQNGIPYFEIATETALHSLMYTLDSNILLPVMQGDQIKTEAITGTSQQIQLYDLGVGANYIQTSNIQLDSLLADDEEVDLIDNLHGDLFGLEDEELVLRGVYNGQGYTISNIESLNSQKLALFDSVLNGAVLKDVTLSYATVDLSLLGWTLGEDDLIMPTELTYFGFVANKNFGCISGCSIVGQTETTVKNTYFENTNNIVLGGIAGQNKSTTLEDNSVVRASVINCTNSLSMPLDADLHVDSQNYADQYIVLGGIVAENNNSDVINCVNNANLNAFYAGGVVYYNRNGGFVSGCQNTASIMIKPTQSNGASATAGGIVAFNNDSNIAYCVNSGYILGWSSTPNSSYNNITVGGIVGRIRSDGGSTIISNCLQTYTSGAGIQINPVGGEEESSWDEIYIGYIVGGYNTTGSLIVQNCAYKPTPTIQKLPNETVEEYQQRVQNLAQYFARYVCGTDGEETSDNFVNIQSLADKEKAMSVLNVSAIVDVNGQQQELVAIQNDQKPLFVLLQDSVEMIKISLTTEYEQLAKTGAQTSSLAENIGFVVKLADGSEFDLTTISKKAVLYEIVDNNVSILSETKPTALGTYNVYVYYHLDQSFTSLDADLVFAYTYTIE